MDKRQQERRKEITQVLIQRGCPEEYTKHNFIRELDDNRARVYCNQVIIGIYDFDRHTFVD